MIRVADDTEADENEDDQTQYGGTQDKEPTTDLDENDEGDEDEDAETDATE